MILLDSDVLIDLFRKDNNKSDEILKKLEEMEENDIRISSLVLEEVVFGIIKKSNTEKIKNHQILSIPVVPFNFTEAVKAAEIEYLMEKKGKKKPRGDILIAATAISTNAKLFTFNIRHYEDIPDLQLL